MTHDPNNPASVAAALLGSMNKGKTKDNITKKERKARSERLAYARSKRWPKKKSAASQPKKTKS